MKSLSSAVAVVIGTWVCLAGPVAAQLAVSANDGKVKLVDGKVEIVKDGKDSVAIIDLNVTPPKILAELEAPASVVGPPLSVAITPNEQIALVTSAQRGDPADPTKQIPDNRVSVIDLGRDGASIVGRIGKATGLGKAETAAQPKVLATIEVGKGPSGISINRAGTLALVANRNEGTVSVLSIEGKTVKVVGKVDFGAPASGPSSVAFTPDGKMALVSRDNDHKISILTIDGTKVDYAKRDMNAGLRPYGLDIARKGDVAVVANIGVGQGDADTISVIDMKLSPPRVVNTITVGQTPEGIKMSPDGRYVAVSVMNGSNKAKASPFFRDYGVLQIYTRNGTQLTKLLEEKIGKWCQGIAWNAKSNVVLAQCMVEEEIHAFRLAGITSKGLAKIGTIKTKGGPAGIRTVEK
jgi:DNA-binding beta-propeller fold protein YncE